MVELENHKPVIPVVITESGKDQGMLTQWVTISSPREALPHLVITNMGTVPFPAEVRPHPL